MPRRSERHHWDDDHRRFVKGRREQQADEHAKGCSTHILRQAKHQQADRCRLTGVPHGNDDHEIRNGDENREQGLGLQSAKTEQADCKD